MPPDAKPPRPVRYRGLTFPPAPDLVGPAAAQALAAGRWQAAYTTAALELARTEDAVAIAGAGIGHLPALLAGKLGLPRVLVLEADPARRAYLAEIARANGLPRIGLGAEEDLPAFAPALLCADLSRGGALPVLAGLSLRAALVEFGRAPAPARIGMVFAAMARAGLVYLPALSQGATVAFQRA
jgi:hypothetical protein